MAITRDLWLVLRARDEASRIVRSFGTNVGTTVVGLSGAVSNFDRAIQTAAVRMDQFARTAMLAGTVLAGAGIAGLTFIKEATNVAAEYDRQVRRTYTQIDGITTSLEEVAEVGRRVAREVGIPFEEFQETLFFIFSSMNVSIQEAEELLRGFAKEAVAGQSTVEAAARTTIAIMNALGLTVKDLSRIQDVQFQIVRKGIITYEELAGVIGRALPATARAGQSFETLGAMIAFLTRNGLSAAMAATSAARAMESFAHPTTVKRLEQMGIKVRDARGEFLPLVEVMEQMNKKLKDMSAPERAGFLQELFKGAGGTIQARRFWDVAFKNFGDFEEMIGHMKNSTGVFEDAYATMSESVAAKSELIRNKWMLIQEALGRAVMPHFLKFLTLIDQLLSWFDNLSPSTKEIIGQFILWGSVISIAVGILIVFIGTMAFFVSSILAGGTALAVILGAVVAATAAILALGLAIHQAWQRSEQFRNVVNDLGSVIKTIWASVVTEFNKVRASFEKDLMPPLTRLADIVENRVMPGIRTFIEIWRQEVLPKLQEGGRIIGDLVGKAFEYIGAVIDKIIIPAIEKLTDWWQRNSDSIRPFLSFAAQLVKWLMVIAAVILGSPIVALVTMIAAVIVVIGALIFAVQKLWEWLKQGFAAIQEFFNMIGQRIAEFGQKIWNTWSPLWTAAFKLVKEIWGLIMDWIKLITTLIAEIIKDWIKPLIDYVVGQFNKFKQGVQEVMNFIYNNVIRPVLDAIKGFWNDHLKGIYDRIVSVYKDIRESIMNAIKDVINFFRNAGDWLLDAGRKFITGFINGITEKVKDLRNKLQEITKNIPEWKGPKSVDLRLLMPVGRNIMKSLMSGIDSQVPILQRQLQGITAQINQIPAPTISAPTLTGAPVQQPTEITQNINIYTNEIDPRIHATELGFELGARF